MAPGVEPRAAKRALRASLLAARGRRSHADADAAARACAAHLLAVPEVRRATTVACYVAVGGEPGTAPLLHALGAADDPPRVLLPVVTDDLDLDWAEADSRPWVAGGLAAARLGLLEPTGPRLGRDAVAGADVVLVPGLAVDGTGLRMGRGGGCYDRAFARVGAGAWTCVLLHPEEVGVWVPGEPHDRRVAAAATAAGVTRFAR